MNGLSLLCETWSWSLECYMPVSNWELYRFVFRRIPSFSPFRASASIPSNTIVGWSFWFLTSSLHSFSSVVYLSRGFNLTHWPFCQINASLSHLQPPYPVQAVGRSCSLCWVMETKWVSPPRNSFYPSWENPTMQIACRFLSDLPLKVQRLGC